MCNRIINKESTYDYVLELLVETDGPDPILLAQKRACVDKYSKRTHKRHLSRH